MRGEAGEAERTPARDGRRTRPDPPCCCARSGSGCRALEVEYYAHPEPHLSPHDAAHGAHAALERNHLCGGARSGHSGGKLTQFSREVIYVEGLGRGTVAAQSEADALTVRSTPTCTDPSYGHTSSLPRLDSSGRALYVKSGSLEARALSSSGVRGRRAVYARSGPSHALRLVSSEPSMCGRVMALGGCGVSVLQCGL